jgi:hypothetical protein
MKADMTEYVQHYVQRWVVAVCRDGRYYAPMTEARARLTGCAWASGTLEYVAGCGYSYSRRADALRRARLMFRSAELEAAMANCTWGVW